MKPRSLTCGSWSSTVTTGLRRMTALSMSHLPCGESACEVWKLPSSLRKSQAHSEKSLCTKLGSRRMRVPSECSRTVTPQRQLGELCKRSVHVWSPFFSPFWIDHCFQHTRDLARRQAGFHLLQLWEQTRGTFTQTECVLLVLKAVLHGEDAIAQTMRVPQTCTHGHTCTRTHVYTAT